MRDYGLLASIAAVLAAPALLVRPWPEPEADWRLLDRVGGSLAIGLVVGRLLALALDDPSSLTSLADLLVIRSGVEFWPGLAAGIAWLAWTERRADRQPLTLLARVASAGLVGWAAYEAACLVRDGCPGPISRVGLRPEGLVQREFPVALVIAAAAVLAGWLLDRARRHGLADADAVVLAIGAVALVRSIASVWLPHVGSGLTRQHLTSLVVLAGSVVALVIVRLRRAHA